MFGKRKSKTNALALIDDRQRNTIAFALARLLWRFRRQLAPVAVALLVLAIAVTALIVRMTAGTGWLIASYAVAALCAFAWLTRLHGYDRGLAAIVLTITGPWTMLVAYQPGNGGLYGLWALATPVLGLGWWMSGTLRAQLRADAVKQRWNTVAQIAGVAGSKLLATRKTPAGEVLTVKLAAGQTPEDISRKRIEGAYELRPGAVKVEQDKTNARKVLVHLTETDPWTQPLIHPATYHINNSTGRD
ncbi:hypothetical protein [Catelliglobosispora koreensis]|uniref:hypothetical protein n=1 Tax=Catelliglobosispora koreensis TaxID=129052 RepID=UPI00036F3A95|nr:hypothetical protein [Catelliglobosispora koreensis]